MDKYKLYHTHIFRWIRHGVIAIISILCLSFWGSNILVYAQDSQNPSTESRAESKGHFIPRTFVNGEWIPTITLRKVVLYRSQPFKNARERIAYTRLVRDVKRVYPYAKIVAKTILETYKYIETLPEDERDDHLHRMEKELYAQYSPQLKRLTYRQGAILMKLIMRETNNSSYQLIEAFLGSFAAMFWNAIAHLFGSSLKTEWNPEGEDAPIERVCIQIEYGLI